MHISDMWLQNQLMKQQQQMADAPPSAQNPALVSALQQPRAQPGDPIGSGASAAMGAARQSEQSFGGRLMGALGKTISNYAISGLRTSPSSQARMIGSMMPTVDEREAMHRQQEAARVAQNMEMLNYLSKQAQIEHAMRHKDEALRETRRYHDILGSHNKRAIKNEHLQQKTDALRQSGKMPEGAILLDSIDNKQIRKMREEELKDRAQKLNPMIKGLKNLDQMEDIIGNNPNLYNSLARIVDISMETDPTVLRNFYAGFTKNELADVQKMKKLANDLVVNEIKAFPGKPTDLVKRTIMKTIADAGTTPEAFKLVKDNLSEVYLRQARDAKVASDARKFGYYIPENIEEQAKFLESYGNKSLVKASSQKGAQEGEADTDELDLVNKRNQLMQRKQQLIGGQ